METFKLKVVSPCVYTSCFLVKHHAEYWNTFIRENIKKKREEYAWLVAWKEYENAAALPKIIVDLEGSVSYFPAMFYLSCMNNGSFAKLVWEEGMHESTRKAACFSMAAGEKIAQSSASKKF